MASEYTNGLKLSEDWDDDLFLEGFSRYITAPQPNELNEGIHSMKHFNSIRCPQLKASAKYDLSIGTAKSGYKQDTKTGILTAWKQDAFRGLSLVLKVGLLLLSRVFFKKSWRIMQFLSLCPLCARAVNPKPAQVESVIVPFQSIALPVAGVTIARPLFKWIFPDTFRTASFWKRLFPIYMRYMITKLQARGKPLEEKNKIWAKRHEWGGEKVHQLVLDMSGFYVKSAQILASKADFVPDAWRTWLSKHLDSAPPRPFREIRKSIEEQLVLSPFYSLGKTCSRSVSLSEVFSNVDPDPIAAASIAQVHGAQLKDGTRVVLKVQHLGMERIMHSDLRNLGRVANFLKGQLPVDLGPIVKEIQTCIPLEFDFEREVWFMEKIRNSLAAHGFNRIVCPSPFNELSTKCLIVMERLDGVPFTRILEQNPDEEIQRKRLVEVKDLMLFLVEAYGQMVLLDGIFHADPHAGNLLLLSDGRLGLLDFGQSKVLDECTRKGFAKMVLALANNDEMAIAFALVDLGMRFENAGGDTPPVNILAKMARMLFDTCYVEEATVSPMADNSILRTTPLKSFNQSLWMVVRAILILRGLLYTLKMDISAVTIWQPYALRALEN